MARPRPDLPVAAVIRAQADSAGRLAVRVTPGARCEALQVVDGRVLAKVRARPEDGKATAEVTELLAAALGVATSRLQLLRGATVREKLFQLPD
ncbi:DUF167 domain-containing protein [Novosphingobium aquiterrae]|uniref:DUF167 domain-containing protein n=1 Tax=Novosphingobium aquiterrae TaxID=624388 RepID=A0ABV6PJN4_9SPHN